MPAISDQVASIEHDLAVAQTSVDSLRSENDQLKQALAALSADHSALQAKYSDASALVDETRQHADGIAGAALAMLKASRRQIGAVQPSEASKALTALTPSLEAQSQAAVAAAIEPEKTDVRPELPVVEDPEPHTTTEFTVDLSDVPGDQPITQVGWGRDMQDALHADAEKLSQITGEDHSVTFLDDIPNTDRLRQHMPGEDPLPIFLAPRNPPGNALNNAVAGSVLG